MADLQKDKIEFALAPLLKKRGMSMYKLAKDSDVSYIRIRAYCMNKVQRPDLDLLARICRALDCEVGDILRFIPGDAK